MESCEVYLDYQSTTPCDPRVTEVIIDCLAGCIGNPSSQHRSGSRARARIANAAEQIAEMIGALPDELIFTSGATEANNLALKGLCTGPNPRRKKLITTPIEHASVLASGAACAASGFKLEICPVKRDGTIDLAALADLVDDSTLIVSVQLVNNELGTIQPLREISELAHSAGALVHTDAAQAIGRHTVDVLDLGCDLMSISGHKFYGPKGVGCLYASNASARPRLGPILHGGGQQTGLRPGTLDPAYIAGLGTASEIVSTESMDERARFQTLRDDLESRIIASTTGVTRNGSLAQRVPNATSLTIEGVDADALCANLPSISLSAGSACSSGTPEPSHVLTAIGMTTEQAYQTIRLSVGRMTSVADIDVASSLISTTVERIRDSLRHP